MKVKDGTIRRLHQEDLCQALVMPAQKYTADGGPTTRDIQELLVNTSHHQLNLYLFTQILFFNAIIGARMRTRKPIPCSLETTAQP